jgi:hypothetical protein
MSKELRFITKNGHKVREFQSLFANTQYMIVPAAGHSGEQRRRYAFAAGLSRPPQHSAHRPLRRTVADAF